MADFPYMTAVHAVRVSARTGRVTGLSRVMARGGGVPGRVIARLRSGTGLTGMLARIIQRIAAGGAGRVGFMPFIPRPHGGKGDDGGVMTALPPAPPIAALAASIPHTRPMAGVSRVGAPFLFPVQGNARTALPAAVTPAAPSLSRGGNAAGPVVQDGVQPVSAVRHIHPVWMPMAREEVSGYGNMLSPARRSVAQGAVVAGPVSRLTSAVFMPARVVGTNLPHDVGIYAGGGTDRVAAPALPVATAIAAGTTDGGGAWLRASGPAAHMVMPPRMVRPTGHGGDYARAAGPVAAWVQAGRDVHGTVALPPAREPRSGPVMTPVCRPWLPSGGAPVAGVPYAPKGYPVQQAVFVPTGAGTVGSVVPRSGVPQPVRSGWPAQGRPPFIAPAVPVARREGDAAPVAARNIPPPAIQVTIPVTLDHHVLGQAVARIDTSRARHEHRATGTAPDGVRHAQLPGRSIGL
ncbi:hypothetical protein [Komagataeibacter saccharivorans]|uniref:hypothetical protein n=1 Tax=Komagataeibacter saccharivorans TaxID=265959 RepID=UPI0024A9BA6B|nr:hypothetical protein [Komagataeibacter saccharivorans]